MLAQWKLFFCLFHRGEAYSSGACPVKFMPMRSEAHFTGIGPEDRTGV